MELLTNLNGLQHVNKADIEDCLKQLNELKTEVFVVMIFYVC